MQARVRAAFGLVAIDPPGLEEVADRFGRLLRDKQQFAVLAGTTDRGVQRPLGRAGEPAQPRGHAGVGHVFGRGLSHVSVVHSDEQDVRLDAAVFGGDTGFTLLSPWTGLAVLCSYAGLAVAAAAWRLRTTDA